MTLLLPRRKRQGFLYCLRVDGLHFNLMAFQAVPTDARATIKVRRANSLDPDPLPPGNLR